MRDIWRDDARDASFWAILGLGVVLALALVLPGQAVVTRYVNDLLIFLDGAYRVNQGQVPNRDFHTALGPLNFYLPALAARITGTLGTAMPMATAALVLLVAPVAAYAIASRLRPALGLPFGAFLLLILAVPMNLGEGIADLSYGMFYNRVGWVAVALLVVLHLAPTEWRAGRTALDAAAAFVLVMAALYTKASYGLVAIALVALAIVEPVHRRWAALALALVAVGMVTVEAAWGGTAAHVADLQAAMLVSGDRSPRELADMALRNLADYVLFAVVVGLSLWRTRRPSESLLYAACAGAGLLLISQNFQSWGVITLHAGAVVAAERLMRSPKAGDFASPSPLPAGAPLFMLALLLPTIVHCAAALVLSTALSLGRAGEPFALRNYEGLRLAQVRNPGDTEANGRYLATLREGAGLLQRLTPAPTGVFTLDFVNPFTSAAGLPPPRGDTAWQHWGRNVNEYAFIPPERMFGSIDVVMEPKVAIEGMTRDNLRRVYGPYLAAHFTLAQESESWRILRRARPSGDAPGPSAMLDR